MNNLETHDTETRPDTDTDEQTDAAPGRFVAVKSTVVKGGETIARARSKTMAKRIAKALNNHAPNAEGV